MSPCMWPLRSSSAAYWPSPGSSASTSLVSWPCRYSAVSAPREDELAAVGAIDHARLLAEEPVLAVELDRRRLRPYGHARSLMASVYLVPSKTMSSQDKKTEGR